MSTIKTFGTIEEFCKQLIDEQKNIVEDSVVLSVDEPRVSFNKPSVATQKVNIEFYVYSNNECSYTKPFIAK